MRSIRLPACLLTSASSEKGLARLSNLHLPPGRYIAGIKGQVAKAMIFISAPQP